MTIPTDDLEHYLYDLRNGAVVACSLAKIIEAKRMNRPIIAQQIIDSVKVMLNPQLGISPHIAGAGSCYQALRELECKSSRPKAQVKTPMVKSETAPRDRVSNGLVFAPTENGEVLFNELVAELERILTLLKKTAGMTHE